MTAGPMPPNPVELLSGNRFLHLLGEAGEGFAHIVVDSPPVVGISDAIVLGNQIDNMIFVVEAGRTRKAHVRSSLKRLRQAGVFPLGIILNKVRAVSDLYGYGGHHYDTANRPAIARDDAAG
jgi:Mrp family chromosome partitioning ATPase